MTKFKDHFARNGSVIMDNIGGGQIGGTSGTRQNSISVEVPAVDLPINRDGGCGSLYQNPPFRRSYPPKIIWSWAKPLQNLEKYPPSAKHICYPPAWQLSKQIPAIQTRVIPNSFTRQLAFSEPPTYPNQSSFYSDYRSNILAKVATAVILAVTALLLIVFA
uniref:Uncharacterized protein n=1 Tax=Romanomermis culicivorax TaxID=13658 RepID=A0A915HEP5_ROMCU